MHTRAQDFDKVVKKRMAKAMSEMSHWNEYDYIIVNEDVGDSVTKVEAFLAAERLKTNPSTWNGGLRPGHERQPVTELYCRRRGLYFLGELIRKRLISFANYSRRLSGNLFKILNGVNVGRKGKIISYSDSRMLPPN